MSLPPSPLTAIRPLLASFLAPWYGEHDTMHDATHIRRITRRAVALAAGIECDLEVLQIAALLHGVPEERISDVRAFLATHQISSDLAEHLFLIARESDKDADPVTV